MITIKYVGAKDNGERAFMEETGIEWFPGDVKDVTPEAAGKMLRHPDVFEQVTGPAVKLADKPVLKAVATDDLDADDEAIRKEEAARLAAANASTKTAPTGDADPLAGMDDAGVKAFAKAQGLKVAGIGLIKGDKLRDKVREALGAKQ